MSLLPNFIFIFCLFHKQNIKKNYKEETIIVDLKIVKSKKTDIYSINRDITEIVVKISSDKNKRMDYTIKLNFKKGIEEKMEACEYYNQYIYDSIGHAIPLWDENDKNKIIFEYISELELELLKNIWDEINEKWNEIIISKEKINLDYEDKLKEQEKKFYVMADKVKNNNELNILPKSKGVIKKTILKRIETTPFDHDDTKILSLNIEEKEEVEEMSDEKLILNEEYLVSLLDKIRTYLPNLE